MKLKTLRTVWLLAMLLILAGLVAPSPAVFADGSDATATGGCVEKKGSDSWQADNQADQDDPAVSAALASMAAEQTTTTCGKTAPASNPDATPPEHGWSAPDGVGGGSITLGCNLGDGALVLYDTSYGGGVSIFSGYISVNGRMRPVRNSRGVACWSPWGCTIADTVARNPNRILLSQRMSFYWAADPIADACF